MNIEKQILEDHHAQLTVRVDADRLETAKRRAASQMAKRIKIPGFRPGKAPYPVILRQLGEAAILEEAIEILVDEIYPAVIKEAEIKPYGPGKLENITGDDPLTLVFSVPLEAEAVLGDYHAIQKSYEPAAVSDDDVADVLENLRERNAIIEPVDRPAQPGDLVTITLSATRMGEDGQVQTLIPERSTSIIVRPVDEPAGEDRLNVSQDEWPFPGFSQNLVGMSSNEEKSVEYTYPEDINQSSLKGTVANFHFKVEGVKSRQLPNLDDEFAKTVGEFDTLEALRADIHKSLEAQAREAYNEEYDDEILDAAIEQTAYKIPPEMVDHEIDTVISELRQRLERRGMDMGLYLKSRGIGMNDFREEVKPVALERIKRALFLVNFSKAENIEVKSEELEKEAFSTIDFLYNTLPERDARKLSQPDVYTNIVGNLYADMLSRISLARFRELCSGGLSKDTEEETEEQTEEQTEEAVSDAQSEPVDEAAEVQASIDGAADTDIVLPPTTESEKSLQSDVQ